MGQRLTLPELQEALDERGLYVTAPTPSRIRADLFVA